MFRFDCFWTQKMRDCWVQLWAMDISICIHCDCAAGCSVYLRWNQCHTSAPERCHRFKNEIKGRSSEDIYICVHPNSMPHKHCGGTPKPIAVWGIHFSIRPQKRKLNGFREKSMIALFSILSTLNLGNQVLFKTARKTKTNLPKKRGCPNMEPFHTLQSPKPDTDSTGTGVPFLASTAWVYAPGTNNFPKAKRVCFCVRFPPLCVTYLQQHETVNMFETKNIDAQHGSSCKFYIIL